MVGLCEIGDEKLVASAMRAGARGCVDMGADGPELLRAVAAAGRGQAILSGPVLQQLHRGLQEYEPEPDLTDREREVMAMVAGGLSNDEIAARLYLSPLTAKTHVSRIMTKLSARDRAQLVVLGYETGMVTPGQQARLR